MEQERRERQKSLRDGKESMVRLSIDTQKLKDRVDVLEDEKQRYLSKLKRYKSERQRALKQRDDAVAKMEKNTAEMKDVIQMMCSS